MNKFCLKVTEFQLSYSESWKMMLLKCCPQYVSKFGKLSSDHRTGKGQFSFQFQMPVSKNVQTTVQLHSLHMLVRLCLKSFKLDFSIMWTDFQRCTAEFRKGRWTRDELLPTWVGSWRQQGSSRKTSASLTTLRPFTVWITTNCGKFLKRWEYQTTLPVSWETCTQVRKQQLVLDMEQWIGSKLGKGNVKAVYCHPVYLTSVQSTSCEWEAG